MPRAQRLHCKWSGCTAKFSDEKGLRKHEAEPHSQCVCSRHATTAGMKVHQRSCSVYQFERDMQRYACAGCSQEIVEGMHYMHIPEFTLQTRMPAGSQLPANLVSDLSFCTPTCFVVWLQSNELVLDVFEDPHHWNLFHYEVFVDGARMWYVIDDAAEALCSTWAHVRMGEQVKLPGGSVRMLTRREQENVANYVAKLQEARRVS